VRMALASRRVRIVAGITGAHLPVPVLIVWRVWMLACQALGDFMCNFCEEEAVDRNGGGTHPNAAAHEIDGDVGGGGQKRALARGPPVHPPAPPVQGRVLNLDTCSPLLVRPTHLPPASRKPHTHTPAPSLEAARMEERGAP
jgi:hypothetical protein